ncbi:hypothetical protein OOK29_29140 [Streptomyces phaeochromogenes]|uniref:hypothetical protein n=1 Tax=Streptomyces phaeochromogenes TaxID=1923 RepID=UPI0022534DD1|nr:hypothetical protein [Streptomyces phaeochromogenes]MCX5602231.1 hypothetical protein [Streptomyces phaeochromogenes]
MSLDLPPVAPAVTAELVQGLTPRLRKRLDAGITKLAGRPSVRDGDTVRIAVDDDTHLELHAPGGTVTSTDAIRCGCLLAPDCLHRAAAASAAPIAEPEPDSEPQSRPQPLPDAGPASVGEDATGTPDTQSASPTEPETPTPDQRAAAQAMYDAAAAVLEAGTDGAGAVLQAELLRAAHSARISGLPRIAASAVSVVTQLRAARGADPAYRLAELTAALREVLLTAHRLPGSTGPELATLRGTARQPYSPDGSLRLYGLFSEPVLTATGYAGAVTWTADAEGRLYTVSDVVPGGPGRAVGAADRAVRIGDTALTHRELSRAGLAVSGATVSPTGRLGAGAGVRAVRASGAAWRDDPLAGLWELPVTDQVSRALTGGDGLLFLDVTLIGTVREAAGDCLLADCDGLTLRLAAAHDHPALPYRDNLRLLSAAPGTRLRVVARLAPSPLPRALLLASDHPRDPGAHLDLGLDRLQHADLPAPAMAPAGSSPAPDEAPLHLLRRRVHQAASAGRRVLAFPGDSATDSRRLGRYGLACAGDLLDELRSAAADRSRDVFGRLVPADINRFARAWVAAAHYTEEVDRSLCAAAWGADPALPPAP